MKLEFNKEWNVLVGRGGFSGGRTLLGSNPRRQSFFFAASLHSLIKVRKFAFFSAGILSFNT